MYNNRLLQNVLHTIIASSPMIFYLKLVFLAWHMFSSLPKLQTQRKKWLDSLYNILKVFDLYFL